MQQIARSWLGLSWVSTSLLAAVAKVVALKVVGKLAGALADCTSGLAASKAFDAVLSLNANTLADIEGSMEVPVGRNLKEAAARSRSELLAEGGKATIVSDGVKSSS